MQVMRDARASKHALQGLGDLENAVDTLRVA
jgi:hypothetical protein